MSKKETRRAARQAFPKAKTAVPAKTGTGARARGSGSSSRAAANRALRPPTLKRAAIQGAIVAALYFVFIQFLWRAEGTTPMTNALFALGGFVLYTGVAYAVDKFKYERKLRKLKGPSK